MRTRWIAGFLAAILCTASMSGCAGTKITEQELARLEEEIRTLTDANASLREELESAAADGNVSEQAISALEEEIRTLTEANASLTEELKSAAADGNASEQAISALEEEIRALTDTNASLTEELKSAAADGSASAQTVSDLQKEIRTLTDANAAFTKEMESLRNERSASAQTISGLQEKNRTLTDTNKALTDTVASLKDANQTLQNSIAALREAGAVPSGKEESSESGTAQEKKAANPVNSVYSSSELAAIAKMDLDEARKYISTVEDATHYLALQEATFYSGMGGLLVNFSLEEATRYVTQKGDAAPQTVTTLAAYLLSDDYTDIGYLVAPVKEAGKIWPMCGIYVKVDDTYHVASVTRFWRTLKYTKDSRSADFDPFTVTDLSDAARMIVLKDQGEGDSLIQLFTAPYQKELSFKEATDVFTLNKGEAREIFRISDAEIQANKEAKATATLESLLREFPRRSFTSKGATLSAKEAMALVDSGLENVKEKCKSLEDVLLYMAAAGSLQAGGDIQTQDTSGTFTWHFNYSAAEVYRQKQSNCGGTASFVAYLLEGDYDEVGMLAMRGYEGGHVINYIRDGSTWISVDINSFHGTDYNPGSIAYNPGKDLISVGQKAASMYRGTPYLSVIAAPRLSGDPEEGDIPVGWDFTYLVRIPSEYRDTATIILETPEEGFTFEWAEVSEKMWNKINALRNG